MLAQHFYLNPCMGDLDSITKLANKVNGLIKQKHSKIYMYKNKEWFYAEPKEGLMKR